MTLSPTDNLAGIAKTLFKLDDGDWTEGTSVEVPVVEGEHTILYYSKDAASPANVEDTKTAKVFIDTTAPTTTDNAPAGYQSEAVTVTLSPTDNLAGVAKTLFKLDDGDWTEGTSVEVPVVEGEHTILYYSKDAASPANVEDTKTAKVFIDTTAPWSAINPTQTGWHKTDVTLTVSGDDTLVPGITVSGLKTLHYVSDTHTANCGSPTDITYSAEGKHKLELWAEDNAGNLESPRQRAEVWIDKTAPTTSDNIDDVTWYQSPKTVDLSASDQTGLSGVKSTEYKLDGATWTTYTVPFEVNGEGIHTVQYRSTDYADNIENTQTATVNVDNTAPVTTVHGADGAWHTAPVSLSFTATDTSATPGVTHTSGVDYTQYRVDGGDWAKGTSITIGAPIDSSNDGVHTVDYRSADKTAPANVESFSTVTVKIDTKKPVVNIGAPADGAVYTLNQTKASSWSVDDPAAPSAGGESSGVDTATGTKPSGTAFDTGTLGKHTFTVTAKDKAGNEATLVTTYWVGFNWLNFQQPINVPPQAMSVFNCGSTIPVKFRVTDANNQPVTGLAAQIRVVDIGAGLPATYVAETIYSSDATSGDLFRYDSAAGQYMFNLGTLGKKGSSMKSGRTYRIEVTFLDLAGLPGGNTFSVLIGMK